MVKKISLIVLVVLFMFSATGCMEMYLIFGHIFGSGSEAAVEEVPAEAESEELPVITWEESVPVQESFYGSLPEDFYFASGVGGWATCLVLSADGTFTGDYHDSDMGDRDEDLYPNGTMYICQFEGAFDDPVQVSEYEYTARIRYLVSEKAAGQEIFEDGYRYITTTPYGLENAEEISIFMEGAPTADLPEGFLMWAGISQGWGDNIPETLPFYGIYNSADETGFVGIPAN